MTMPQNPFDFNMDDPDEDDEIELVSAEEHLAIKDRLITAMKEEMASLRHDLAFAYRDLDEAQRSIQIARQLTMASLTETRDLCLPHITKSLLYATIEALDFAAEDGGLPDEYQKVRRRTIDQLEKLDAKGVLTIQEQVECNEAKRNGKVVIRYADIMRPRRLMSIDEAIDLLSLSESSGPKIVSGSNPLNQKSSQGSPGLG